MGYQKFPPREEEHGNPSVDQSGRFAATDQHLRACVPPFSIYSRRRGMEPLWLRRGKVYRQSRALRVADREAAERAEMKGGLDS